jgi:hypothetical protein
LSFALAVNVLAQNPIIRNQIKAAIRFVRANAANYQLDTTFIGITGFSSGGHLASLAGTSRGVNLHTVGSVTLDIEGNVGKYTSYNSSIDAVRLKYAKSIRCSSVWPTWTGFV